MDQVIQSNVGASEEMASTAEELSSQAEQLQSAVAFFKIGDDRFGRRGKAVAGSHSAAKPRSLTLSKAATGTAPLKKAAGHDLELSEKKELQDGDFEKY